MENNAEAFGFVAEAIDQTIFLLDWPSMEPRYLSPAFDRMWGFEGRAAGRAPLAWLASLVEADRVALLDEVEALVSQGRFETEFRIVQPGGSVRWIRVLGSAVPNEHGVTDHVAGTATDVTELYDTRAALAHRESLHEAWMQSASDFVVYRLRHAEDSPYQADVEFVSPSLEKVMGIAPDASFDQWFTGIAEDDYARVANAQRESAENGTTFDEIMRITHQRSGELRWVRAISNQHAEPQSGDRIANGLIVDVTDRMLAEAENRLKSEALAYSLNGYFIADERGKTIYANEAFLDMWGYDCLDDITGLAPVNFCANPETITRVLRQIDETGSDEREFTARRRDGSMFEVLVAIRRFIGIDQRPLLMGTTIDVSERKSAQAELERAATVFRHTAEGVVITDAKGCVVDVNEAFSGITGYTRADVSGKHASLFRSTRQDAEFFERIEAEIAAAGHWRGEALFRRADGNDLPTWLVISAVKDPATGRRSGFVMLIADITAAKQSEAQLQAMAHHDALTGLPNRLLLDARLEHTIQRAKREGTRAAVLFLDIDRFKNINDSLGHPAGDEMLREAARRLRRSAREEDTVARIGGDEFVVVLESIRDRHDAGTAAEKVISALSGMVELATGSVAITASVGVVLYPDDGDDTTTLLKHADAAMYRAKETGRNGYRFYTSDMTAGARERLALEVEMRRALDAGDQFSVHYQPLTSLHDGRTFGVEALLRWAHPERGSVSPAEFIPIAEECGLIEPLGKWVLHEACRQLAVWQRSGFADLRVSVNVSGRQVLRPSPSLASVVRDVLDDTGLSADSLSLELTETVLMSDPTAAGAALNELAALGVSFSVDDFGTGYSSLSYLKKFPVSTLKIDRSFVRDAPEDPSDAAICSAVIALAASLGLDVIAEGVETEKHRDFLIRAGCANAQGYFFGRPMPAEDVEGHIAGTRTDGPNVHAIKRMPD